MIAFDGVLFFPVTPFDADDRVDLGLLDTHVADHEGRGQSFARQTGDEVLRLAQAVRIGSKGADHEVCARASQVLAVLATQSGGAARHEDDPSGEAQVVRGGPAAHGRPLRIGSVPSQPTAASATSPKLRARSVEPSAISTAVSGTRGSLM